LGGIRKGLTEGMAKAMAEAAEKNTIETKGLKPTGDIKHTCTSAALGTECAARQQGCT
jgi:multimeric flavodoxin WrbA